jgi:hypothetical protein
MIGEHRSLVRAKGYEDADASSRRCNEWQTKGEASEKARRFGIASASDLPTQKSAKVHSKKRGLQEMN